MPLQLLLVHTIVSTVVLKWPRAVDRTVKCNGVFLHTEAIRCITTITIISTRHASRCIEQQRSSPTSVCHWPASGWCPSCVSCSLLLLRQFFARLYYIPRAYNYCEPCLLLLLLLLLFLAALFRLLLLPLLLLSCCCCCRNTVQKFVLFKELDANGCRPLMARWPRFVAVDAQIQSYTCFAHYTARVRKRGRCLRFPSDIKGS